MRVSWGTQCQWEFPYLLAGSYPASEDTEKEASWEKLEVQCLLEFSEFLQGKKERNFSQSAADEAEGLMVEGLTS